MQDPTGKVKGGMTPDTLMMHPDITPGAAILFKNVAFLYPTPRCGYACIVPSTIAQVHARRDVTALPYTTSLIAGSTATPATLLLQHTPQSLDTLPYSQACHQTPGMTVSMTTSTTPGTETHSELTSTPRTSMVQHAHKRATLHPRFGEQSAIDARVHLNQELTGRTRAVQQPPTTGLLSTQPYNNGEGTYAQTSHLHSLAVQQMSMREEVLVKKELISSQAALSIGMTLPISDPYTHSSTSLECGTSLRECSSFQPSLVRPLASNTQHHTTINSIHDARRAECSDARPHASSPKSHLDRAAILLPDMNTSTVRNINNRPRSQALSATQPNGASQEHVFYPGACDGAGTMHRSQLEATASVPAPLSDCTMSMSLAQRMASRQHSRTSSGQANAHEHEDTRKESRSVCSSKANEFHPSRQAVPPTSSLQAHVRVPAGEAGCGAHTHAPRVVPSTDQLPDEAQQPVGKKRAWQDSLRAIVTSKQFAVQSAQPIGSRDVPQRTMAQQAQRATPCPAGAADAGSVRQHPYELNPHASQQSGNPMLRNSLTHQAGDRETSTHPQNVLSERRSPLQTDTDGTYNSMAERPFHASTAKLRVQHCRDQRGISAGKPLSASTETSLKVSTELYRSRDIPGVRNALQEPRVQPSYLHGAAAGVERLTSHPAAVSPGFASEGVHIQQQLAACMPSATRLLQRFKPSETIAQQVCHIRSVNGVQFVHSAVCFRAYQVCCFFSILGHGHQQKYYQCIYSVVCISNVLSFQNISTNESRQSSQSPTT